MLANDFEPRQRLHTGRLDPALAELEEESAFERLVAMNYVHAVLIRSLNIAMGK